jgi:hypothetical protein
MRVIKESYRTYKYGRVCDQLIVVEKVKEVFRWEAWTN